MSNILDPIRWLRQMTGNADPPGSNYALTSLSTTGTAWAKVSADIIAANNIATAHLQDGAVTTPKHADGSVTAAKMATQTANLQFSGDNIGIRLNGGSLVRESSLVNGFLITAVNDIFQVFTGNGAARIFGANFSDAAPRFKSFAMWHEGNDGPGSGLDADLLDSQNSTFYIARANHTGTQTAATISNFAATVATLPAASAATATTATNAGNANTVAGKTPTATPAPGALPLADAAGKLDAWVTPASFSIPSGLGFWVRTAAEIPSGFVRDTSLDGVIPVGAGTTFGQTFVETTSYGSSWAHVHSLSAVPVSVTSVTVSGSAVGGPSDQTGQSSNVNGLATAGGVNLNTTTHTHSLNGLSLAVSASGTGSGTATGSTQNTTWLPPMRAVVWCRKT